MKTNSERYVLININEESVVGKYSQVKQAREATKRYRRATGVSFLALLDSKEDRWRTIGARGAGAWREYRYRQGDDGVDWRKL